MSELLTALSSIPVETIPIVILAFLFWTYIKEKEDDDDDKTRNVG